MSKTFTVTVNGRVTKRTSLKRVYTHAVLVLLDHDRAKALSETWTKDDQKTAVEWLDYCRNRPSHDLAWASSEYVQKELADARAVVEAGLDAYVAKEKAHRRPAGMRPRRRPLAKRWSPI